jgi:hypothetical protein
MIRNDAHLHLHLLELHLLHLVLLHLQLPGLLRTWVHPTKVLHWLLIHLWWNSKPCYTSQTSIYTPYCTAIDFALSL